MLFPGNHNPNRNPRAPEESTGRAGKTGSPMQRPSKKSVDTSTSWGPVAGWYQEHLKGDDTYHAQVITPNLSRIVNAKKGIHILDIGCGEGFFTRLFCEQGATVVGADIAKELIAIAQKKSADIIYFATPADNVSFAVDSSYDVVTCVLALQNIERIETVFQEVSRVLKPGGRFVFVINHPAFRIPRSSSWGWDAVTQTPGKEAGKSYTYSFHRSLQDYVKTLSNANFSITRLEEWISHRSSEKGPRARAEDKARKEFPLFLCIEALSKNQ
jgi:ubiquinone/menaquinone biosynthesis C-methylase UbiE